MAAIPPASPSLDVIFVLGPPSVDASTICSHFADAHADVCAHLSVDNHLQYLSNTADRLPDAAYGGLTQNQLSAMQQTPHLIHPGTLAEILKYQIDRFRGRGYRVVLIDGFPISRNGIAAFKDEVPGPKGVITFQCEKGTAFARFVKQGGAVGSFDQLWSSFESSWQVLAEDIGGRVKDVVVEEKEKVEESYGKFWTCVSTYYL